MRFGTVRGMLLPTVEGLSITILLETKDGVRVVRDGLVPPELAVFAQSEDWLVDQLVQEMLGTDLAEEGWEVIAVARGNGEATGIESPAYTVRQF